MGIEGIVVKPLQRLCDERGVIMHMLRNDDPLFERFGEIYFSTAYPGVVKGWHLHQEMTLNYAVIQGMIKLVLFDDRQGSPTKGEVQELFLGRDNYVLVKIPPLIWNGFKAIGTETAVVANCSTIPHRRDEMRRMDPFKSHIPYDWALQNR